MYGDDDLISSIRNKKKPTEPLEAPDALEDDYLGPIEEGTEAPQGPTEAERLKARLRELLK